MQVPYAGLILLLIGAAAHAEPKPCDAPEHRQFDFWVGDWIVATPDGRHAGDNHVESILDGCALAESWRGASGGSGHSYNAFDRTRKIWHQTWVDHQGNLLSLEGGLKEGRMVLSGAQGKMLHRITWTPRDDGSVAQLWESSGDRGSNWQVVFHGIYARRPPEPEEPLLPETTKATPQP